MRSLALAPLAAGLAAACSAPPGPPPIDESLSPPRYSAANCSPVDEVARQDGVTTNAILVDLDEGGSCEVFLEQDECVLAVFKDCSYLSGKRQWVGTATPDGKGVRISLTPMFEKAPPRTPPRVCTGVIPDLSDARGGTNLTCEGGEPVRGLYLERKDFSKKAFGQRMPAESVPLGSFGQLDAMPDMTRVAGLDGTETWATVNWSGGGAGGGVYRMRGTPESPEVQAVETVSRARWIGATPEGVVAVGIGEDRDGEMSLALYDARVRDLRTAHLSTSTTSGLIYAIAGATGETFAIAHKPRAQTTHRVHLYTLNRATGRASQSTQVFMADRDTVITALSWAAPAGPGAAAFAVAMTKTGSGEGVVVGLDGNLQEVWRTPAGALFDVRAMETLTGQGRLAVILAGGERDYEGADQSNQYYEINALDGTVGPVVPLPFADTEELSYDAARDRVYVVQRFGVLGYVERQPRVRAAQGYFALDNFEAHENVLVTAMVWDDNRQRIVFSDPRRSVLDSVRLVQP